MKKKSLCRRRPKRPRNRPNPPHLNIVFAASEGVPFCKTGGLADVVGTLSKILARLGHTVSVFLPFYREIRLSSHTFEAVKTDFPVRLADRTFVARMQRFRSDDRLTYYFIDQPDFYDRDGLYGYQSEDFRDNDLRFVFFSRAVLSALIALQIRPDVIHAHDWQTGLLPAYLKTIFAKNDFLRAVPSLLTVHNNAFQGLFPASFFSRWGLPTDECVRQNLALHGQMSFLKSGVVYADMLTTVSPTYKKEISRSERLGYGLAKSYRRRLRQFHGILNGLDIDYWNPATDAFLAKPYGVRDLTSRSTCKADLQKFVGFSVQPKAPVFGFVGRMEVQKGIPILTRLLPKMTRKGAQFVFLGKGNKDLQNDLLTVQKTAPERIYVRNEFSEDLAHKIYAGSDFFLMPSEYEPCGLGQLIAMRYGSIPIVRPTGGLIDTVQDHGRLGGTGFVAKSMTASSYEAAVNRALRIFTQPKDIRHMQIRGMKKDYSWGRSVGHYLRLYAKASKHNRAEDR